MKMGTKEKSVSEKFFDLINPAPPVDPEDDVHEDTVAKVIDKGDDFSGDEQAPGFWRLRPLIPTDEDEDKRYTGQKISRKKLMKQSFHEEKRLKQIVNKPDSLSTTIKDEESDEVYIDKQEEEESGEEEAAGESDKQVNSEKETEETEQSSEEQEEVNSIQHISARAGSDVEKGKAVRNQLKLWDSLLECRIQFQKCLLAANKLPQYSIFPQFEISGGSKFTKEVAHTKHSINNLLEKLITFQNVMLKSYPETKTLGEKNEEKKAHQSDEEIPSDSEESMSNAEYADEENEPTKAKQRKLEDYAQLLESQHKAYVQYRNETIQKWNDKTRLYVGKHSNRNFCSFEQSTVKQIEQILSNRQRLIQRTQLKRSAYTILGHNQSFDHQLSVSTAENKVSSNNTEDQVSSSTAEHQISSNNASVAVEEKKSSPGETKDFDTEIFDDTDFYHQLLREIIERKASDITDPVQLGRQWIELQKLRSKMKRKVDTRATKGRKIRYVVHPKLVNFMAPVPECTWKDEAKTELYNSLFGSNTL